MERISSQLVEEPNSSEAYFVQLLITGQQTLWFGIFTYTHNNSYRYHRHAARP